MNRQRVYKPDRTNLGKLKPYQRRSANMRGSGKLKSKKDNFLIKWLVILLVICFLLIGVGFAVFVLIVGQASKESGEPVLELNLTSNPNGASVFLAGRERGFTPLRLPVSAGHHSIEFRKAGFTSYVTEVEITASPSTKISTSVSATATSTITPTLAAGQSITNTQTTKTLPAYALTAELWPDHSVLQPLSQPLPNARLEYARFLNSKTLELTYLTAEGGTLPPGSEGLPTNLWLYNFNSSEGPSPIILSYSNIQTVAHYYGIVSDEKTTSSSEALSQLAFANPIVSPQGKRLALVSNALIKKFGDQSKVTGNNGAKPNPAWWDDQAIWLSQLDEKLSTGGAVLAGSSNSYPLKLLSLADLVRLLPGISVPSTTGGTSYSAGQRFATIKEVSWSPNGSQLLVAVELNQASLTGNRAVSSGSGMVTMLVLVGTGGGTAPGQAAIVTPQPLTEQILPGTIKWSADGTNVSFVVGQAAGNQSQFSLCVLDLRYANRLGGATETSRNTPLHYLAQLNSTGVWNTRSSYQSSNLAGGKVYPPMYGSIRYNPFAWPVSFSDARVADNPNMPQLSKIGLYSAAPTGQGQTPTSSSRQFNINNIYAYFRDNQSTRLIPNLSDPGSNSKSTPAAAKSVQSQGKTGNYPFWSGAENPLYFATRLVTVDKDKTGQGGLLGGGSSSSSQSWQLAVDTLVLPAEISGRESKPITVAPGVTFRLLTERRSSITLSLATNQPTIPGLAPGRFEVQWHPDGLGALIALAPSSSSQNSVNNQIWLARWDKS